MKNLGRKLLRYGWWLPLIIPSIWFWCSYPPLWRDSDAVYQLTSKPGVLTLLHWPPLYCLGSRLPLALGALWQGVPFSFNEPTLTDAGIGLLLACQHILLWAAAALLVATATRSSITRWILSVIFAVLPVFYAYAHTVGSESLSNALLIALTAVGLAIARHARVPWWLWLAWALVLVLAILTRHVNAVMAAVLPGALIFITLFQLPSLLKADGKSALRSRLIAIGIAIGLGLAGIVVAKSVVRILCYAYNTPYRTRTGYTMQRRLGFLRGIDAVQQDQFIADVAKRLSDPQLIDAWQAFAEKRRQADLKDPDFLSNYLKEKLVVSDAKISGRLRGALLDAKLNTWSKAVLYSGSPPYLEAVRKDFFGLFAWSPADLSRDPFDCTHWIPPHLDEPDFAGMGALSTFRSGFADRASHIWMGSSYLRLGAMWPLGQILVLLSILWIVCAIIRRKDTDWSRLSTVLSLLILTHLIFFLNCWFTNAKPRFALPVVMAVMVAGMYVVAEFAQRKSRIDE